MSSIKENLPWNWILNILHDLFRSEYLLKNHAIDKNPVLQLETFMQIDSYISDEHKGCIRYEKFQNYSNCINNCQIHRFKITNSILQYQ